MRSTEQDRQGKAREIAERVAVSEGMEVVDVECHGGGKKGRVAIYIDKPGGITHADCELVSRQVSAIFDVEDLFPGSYVLEVSSPGLDRKLVRAADYERFAGRKAKLRLKHPLEGRQQLTGRLRGLEHGAVAIELAGGEIVQVSLDEIEGARLVVEI